MLLQEGVEHAREHAAPLLEEEVGEGVELAWEVLVETVHHVGEAQARVAAQEIGLHGLVGRAVLPGAHASACAFPRRGDLSAPWAGAMNGGLVSRGRRFITN